MRSQQEVSVAMALEAVGGYRDGGAPHMVFTGRGARMASAEVEGEARNDETLCKRWGTARVEILAEDDTPEALWAAATTALGLAGTPETALGVLSRWLTTHQHGLLLFADRFDRLMSNLADNDKDWSLRQTLQTEQRIIIIGSAPTISPVTVGYTKAFYGFFAQRRTE